MRKNPAHRLRAVLSIALTGALACIGGVAIPLSQAPDAEARMAGDGGLRSSTIMGGGYGSISERLSSGVTMSISRPQILLSGYSGTFFPSTGYSNPTTDGNKPLILSDWTTPQNPADGMIWAQPSTWNQSRPYTDVGSVGTIQLPQSYFNNNRFYDTNRFTVSFDPPIADPQLNMVMFGWAVGWGDNTYITKPFGKLTIVGATDQSGSSTNVTMSKAAGWDYGGFRFLWSADGKSMEDPTPNADLNRHYIKGNNWSGGTTQFNTGGKPVSSITFVAANAWAQRGGLRTAYAENWGFQLNVPESDSALSRLVPGSRYGDASHAITSTGVRLGASVVEGSKTRYTTTANSGTAWDNSDAGMDALRGRTLPAASAGQVYSIDNVPVSNTSNRTLALQGWIDFNGNGVFDANEASQPVTISPGQTLASLTWNVPATVAASGKQALRLRLGPADQIVGQPSGLASMGEVEDYAAAVAMDTAPDLKITKTTQTSSVEAGGQIVYHLDVTNRSSQTVRSVMVSDQIPSQITSFAASAPQGYLYDGSRNFSWMVGDLAAGATVRITIIGQVSNAVATGSTITNTATTTSPQGCLTAANCTSTVTDTVKEPVLSDISITKSNDLGGANPVVYPGQTFSYSIVVKNNSDRPYTNVVIRDQLPEGLNFVSGTGWTFTGRTGTLTLASLAAGESRTLTINVQVAANAAGKLTNVSVVDKMNDVATCTTTPKAPGCGVDPNPPQIDPSPLSIYKTNDLTSNEVTAGTEFTYTIEVTNMGTETARAVRVTDILPEELEFASTSQAGWATIAGQNALSDPFDLAGGTTHRLYLKVRALVASTSMVKNIVMAEKAEFKGLMAPAGPAATAAIEAKIESCLDGDTSGACAEDAKPFEIVEPPTPTAPVDTWQDTTPVAPSATVGHSLDWVNPGTYFVSQVTITNPAKTAATFTVRAFSPSGLTFQKDGSSTYGGYAISGRVATAQNVTVGANSAVSLNLLGKLATSVTRGQGFPVAYTIDGSDPSACTATSANCYWDENPPRSLR